jgi:hypothetical protein
MGTDIEKGDILWVFGDEGTFDLLHFISGDFDIMEVGHGGSCLYEGVQLGVPCPEAFRAEVG